MRLKKLEIFRNFFLIYFEFDDKHNGFITPNGYSCSCLKKDCPHVKEVMNILKKIKEGKTEGFKILDHGDYVLITPK